MALTREGLLVGIVQVARAVFAMLSPPMRRRMGVLPPLALGISALELVGAAAIYLLLGLLTAPETILDNQLINRLSGFLPTGSIDEIRFAIAGLVLLFFALRGIALVGRAYVEQRIVTAASIEVAESLLAGYLAVPYRFHVSRNSAELVRNAYINTDRLRMSVISPLTRIVADVVLIVALGIAIIVVDPVGAIVAGLLLGGATAVVQRVLRPRLQTWGQRAQAATTGGVQAIQQAIGAIRDIRVLGREERFLAHHGQQRRIQARTIYLSQAANALPRALIEFALIGTVVALTLVTLIGGGAVDEALATLGVFAYAGIRIQQPLQMIVASINSLRYSAAVVDDLAADFAEIDEWRGRLGRSDVSAGATFGPGHGSGMDPFSRELRVSEVRLSYTRDQDVAPALNGVSLSVTRGEFLGVCGPTGGGKSTLLDVIIGLLEPDSGSVTVDGRPLGLQPSWWWGQLGVVSQNNYLTDDTLRNNVAFGSDGSEIDESRLRRAVERAQLADFVETLPDGLDTLVGERGVRLSGGQRQRVAVARALYREPPVIILDEGTSALDTATETALIRALDTIAPDRTLIAVAHRISTLKGADRIVVLEEGRITAEGTYDELLETSATFRTLAGVDG